jgi:cobalt-zinc-cadmium efflux system protein
VGLGHAHGHSHAHGHLDERLDTDRRALAIALGLILVLLVGEVVAGIVADSLALLADAGHMLTDAAALGAALAAAAIAGRPAQGRWTFGFRRVEILAAQLNGLTLVLVAGWIVYAAVRRLADPPEVRGGLVAVVALGGVAVNLVATLVLSRSSRRSLNVRGALVHVATDLAAFAGTAVAGALILVTGWDRFDPLASLAVAVLMLWTGYRLVRESTGVFLELAPATIDPDDVGRAIAAVPGVVECHDVHVWTVTSGFPAFSAHVLVAPDADCHALRRDVEAMLAERFELAHTTLQVEHAPRPLELHRRIRSPGP